MKVLIASDLHGSAAATRKLVARVEAEQPDTLLLLGDILYHGPRNPLPEEYFPKEVVALLEPYAKRIVAVQGNCDAEVDDWMFEWSLLNATQTIEDTNAGVTLFATQGHRPGLNPLEPEELQPLPERCVFCSGHTHVKVLEKQGEVLFVNPGSMGIPKDDGPAYALYENGTVWLKTPDGTELSKLSL